MGSVLRDGLVQLSALLEASDSEPVTYRAGAVDLPIAAARRGRTETATEGIDAVTVSGWVQDWLIAVPALAMIGEPERGHRIITADGEAFEVMALVGDESWRYTDGFRRTYRIHTKGVGQDA